MRIGKVSRMLDAVGRQLFSSGFIRAISGGVNSTLAHKVADAVVNGANSTALQKCGKAVVKGATSAWEKAAESIVNNAIDSTKQWIVGRNDYQHQWLIQLLYHRKESSTLIA